MSESLPTSINQTRKPLVISIVILLLLLGGYFFIPEMRNWLNDAWNVLTSGDEELVHNWVANFGWFGPILLVMAMVAQMFLIIIPSWLLMVVAILAYGPIWGSLIVFVSIFAASSVGYYIGRYLGAATVTRLLGAKTEQKISNFLKRYGIWAIIITRINPMLSNDAVSFIAGMLEMKYLRFITSTMIGIAPLVIYIAILGELTSGLETGLIWGSIVSLVIFVGYIYVDKKINKKQE